MTKLIKWITLDNGIHVPVEEGQTKGEAIDNFVYRNRAKLKPIRLRADYYSRLKVMFSDYHQGKCKPEVYDNVKLFNLDRTMFLVVGEYPDMIVIGKKTCKTHEKFREFWRKKNG